MKNALYFFLLSFLACGSPKSAKVLSKKSIRFASFNVSMYIGKHGIKEGDISSGESEKLLNIASIIRTVRPDVLALMEFDYTGGGGLATFEKNYLMSGIPSGDGIYYPYKIEIPSNTGILSGHDYNNDGKVALPDDGYGFGRYEGQYAFALLSKFPIDTASIRSFQKMLWKDMVDAKQPFNEDGTPYYETAEWDSFRLSSKNHIDIPIKVSKKKNVHVILAHPTPPVFDGAEDRNGLRNYDEIKLIKDYISKADYLIDDRGRKGGLSRNASFVIMGDLNADPVDGDSYPGAINQLLDHELVHQDVSNGIHIPKSNGGKSNNKSKEDKGDPAFDTSFFGKRIDYVLPSQNFEVVGSGIFWPASDEPLFEKVNKYAASDHMLVWVDVKK